MAIYSQGEEYQEEPEIRAASRRSQPDVEEDEVQIPEPKLVKKSASNVSPLLVASCVGIAAIVLFVGGTMLFMRKNKMVKEEEKRQEMIQESLANTVPSEAPVINIPGTDAVVPDNSNTSVGSYSDKTAATLRKWGYTNSEMEAASRAGLSAEALVEEAKRQRAEAQWEALQSVIDDTSEEYKELLNSTWLGGKPLDVSGFSKDITYGTRSVVENVDFEKLEARGLQTFIKCYLENGESVFMQITPQRYNELPDSGNIVIEYTYIEDDEGTMVVLTLNEVSI